MNGERVLHVVLDTNVIFEGLTKQKGSCGLIIEMWLAGLIQVHVSDALAYEYIDVFSRKLSPSSWQRVQPIIRLLLERIQFTSIYYSWRPISPDPNDDLVIDCAMNANAAVITLNIKDFRIAQTQLGLAVLTPIQLIGLLTNEGEFHGTTDA